MEKKPCLIAKKQFLWIAIAIHHVRAPCFIQKKIFLTKLKGHPNLFVTSKFLYSQYRNKEENTKGTKDLFLYRRNFVKSMFGRTVFDCIFFFFHYMKFVLILMKRHLFHALNALLHLIIYGYCYTSHALLHLIIYGYCYTSHAVLHFSLKGLFAFISD